MDVDSSGNDNRGKTATRRRRNLFGSNNDCNNSTLEQQNINTEPGCQKLYKTQ